MTRRFRLFEADALRSGKRTKRQTIVAVSANKPDFAEDEDQFDFICSKPLSKEDLNRLLLQYVSDTTSCSWAVASPRASWGGAGEGTAPSRAPLLSSIVDVSAPPSFSGDQQC
jgi:hypothetical protein